MLDQIRLELDTDEDGASAVEYGLMIAGIAAVIITIVFLLGGQVQTLFQGTCDKIAGGSGSPTSCT